MSKPADLRTLVRLTSFAHMVVQGGGAPSAKPTDSTWTEEKECLILLLKARMMLRDIVEGRLKQGIQMKRKTTINKKWGSNKHFLC